MNQPEYILKNKTRIKTHAKLDATTGMLIADKHLKERKADTFGIIMGVVGGHGGDVYWVWHFDSEKGVVSA